MTDHLFTYGTLGPGQDYEHLLGKGTWQPGFIFARLLPQGWDDGAGYLGVKLDDQTSKVQGHVFSSNELPHHWAQIDEYEGPLYRRTLTSVHLENGEKLTAFVYEGLA